MQYKHCLFFWCPKFRGGGAQALWDKIPKLTGKNWRLPLLNERRIWWTDGTRSGEGRSQKQKVTLPIGFQHWTTALPEIVGKSGNQKELVPPFSGQIWRGIFSFPKNRQTIGSQHWHCKTNLLVHYYVCASHHFVKEPVRKSRKNHTAGCS